MLNSMGRACVYFRRASVRHSWRDNLFLAYLPCGLFEHIFEKKIVKDQIQIGRLSNIYVLSYYPNRIANRFKITVAWTC